MKKGLALILAITCMAAPAVMQAQEYTQPPVKVSKEKVRANGGRIYYSHIVQEKQTLFSISKAYGVTLDEIYEANPNYNLRQEGLKKNQIILIPATSAAVEAVRAAEENGSAVKKNSGSADKAAHTEAKQKDSDSSEKDAKADQKQDEGDYFIHSVRWYEDINDISKKYGISVERIIEFNGLKSKKLKNRMRLKIPRGEETAAVKSAECETVSEDKDEEPEKTFADNLKALFKSAQKKNPVNVSLLMPLTGKGQPSNTGMDFYSGFLMAVRDLAEEGIGTDLSVFDVGGGTIPVTAERIDESDMVIGPVSRTDLGKVLDMDISGTPVISPLDPKAGTFASTHPNFIQAPASVDAQYEDLVKWVKSDLRFGETILVISEKDARNASICTEVCNLLDEHKLPYTQVSYSILEGRNIVNTLESKIRTGTTRAIIASDSEAFVYDVVRNLGLLVYRKHEVVLYSAAKIRSFNTIEVETLHTLNTHVSLSYHIDYENRNVQRFLSEYRALFNTEPTQFSFQGYDIASYFIRACHEYGSDWVKRLSSEDCRPMLQADFMFAEDSGGGLVNQGIRRAIYRPDFSISTENR